MKVFTCNDHEGFWPVGAASVIVARDVEHAYELLMLALNRQGLKKKIPFTLKELNLEHPAVRILCDGDY